MRRTHNPIGPFKMLHTETQVEWAVFVQKDITTLKRKYNILFQRFTIDSELAAIRRRNAWPPFDIHLSLSMSWILYGCRVSVVRAMINDAMHWWKHWEKPNREFLLKRKKKKNLYWCNLFVCMRVFGMQFNDKSLSFYRSIVVQCVNMSC